MFTFEVNKNNIELTEAETVTSGSVNVYFCNFTFSSDWDGLAKTITFRAGDKSVSILLDSTNMCTIPWEVLQVDALQLYAGARGTVTVDDTEEEAVIPTVYCLLGTIRKGTELGDNAQPPAPSIVEQIMNRIETLDEEKQDKLTGTAGQVVGFDSEGNAAAQTGGVDGVTFTPAVSSAGVISWTNDGGRENPAPVNIKGQPGDPGNNGVTPHIGDNGHWYIGETDTGVAAQGPTGPSGTYMAGAGIEIANDTIGLKNTASTKYNSGTANITGIGGFDFTLTSQTSNIISITEYLKTSPSGDGSTAFKTRYGYAQIKISARRSATLSTAKALRIVMSDSVNMMGATGFARITHGEQDVTGKNIYIALVYADSDYLYVYPTQTISTAQNDILSIDLFVH